jgi:DNA polymerase
MYLSENKENLPRFREKTAAAIIEFPNNKILLIKRKTIVFKGYWALPGGKVEVGETIEETVVREVKEETNLNVEIISKVGKYHEKGFHNGINYDYHPTCFLVKPIEGKIKKQEKEIEQIKLFKINEIPKRLAFKHSEMIKDYLQNKALTELADEIRECKKCRLYKTRIFAVPGEGSVRSKIIVCGQAPGRNEDKMGKPFIGRAGKLLNELLETIKLKREWLFITSTTKCFPPNNRSPKSDELEACKPFLEKQIKIIKPEIIITLGNFALQSILGKKHTISKLHGQLQTVNEKIIFPTFHPAAALRFPKIKTQMKEDFKKLERLLTKLEF